MYTHVMLHVTMMGQSRMQYLVVIIKKMFGAKRPRLEKSLSICILFDMDFVIIQDSIHGGSLKVYYFNSWWFIWSWHTCTHYRSRFTRSKKDGKLTQNFYEKKKISINLRILKPLEGEGNRQYIINFYHSVRFFYKFNMLKKKKTQPPQKTPTCSIYYIKPDPEKNLTLIRPAEWLYWFRGLFW